MVFHAGNANIEVYLLFCRDSFWYGERFFFALAGCPGFPGGREDKVLDEAVSVARSVFCLGYALLSWREFCLLLAGEAGG